VHRQGGLGDVNNVFIQQKGVGQSVEINRSEGARGRGLCKITVFFKEFDRE